MGISDTIQEAVSSLGLSERVVPVQSPEPFLSLAEEKFTSEAGPLWWWDSLREDLPASSRVVKSEDFSLVAQICPDLPAWLVASDESPRPWPVFEARPRDIAAILGECHLFEFMVVSKELEWIVLENHHNTLIAVGEPVSSNLSRLAV